MDAYDAEFRGAVLAACDTDEERRAIALRFEVSESWLRRIQQQRRETGQAATKKNAPRQPKWQAWAVRSSARSWWTRRRADVSTRRLFSARYAPKGSSLRTTGSRKCAQKKGGRRIGAARRPAHVDRERRRAPTIATAIRPRRSVRAAYRVGREFLRRNPPIVAVQQALEHARRPIGVFGIELYFLLPRRPRASASFKSRKRNCDAISRNGDPANRGG